MSESKQRKCPMCGKFMRYNGAQIKLSLFAALLGAHEIAQHTREAYTCRACGRDYIYIHESGRLVPSGGM